MREKTHFNFTNAADVSRGMLHDSFAFSPLEMKRNICGNSGEIPMQWTQNTIKRANNEESMMDVA
jgi:hypothetical protein